MSDGATTCEQCGAKVATNTQFCGGCGALIEDAPIPTTSGTMVGISDRPVPAATGPMPASGGGGVPKKTLMGTPDMLAGLMPPAAPAPSSSSSDEPLSKPSDRLKNTINGLSGEMPPVIPPESPLPPKPDEGTRTTSTGVAGPQRGKMGRTMVGMPMAAGTMGQRAGTLPPTGKLAEKKPAKTMFGMAGAPISTDTPQPGERVGTATIVAASPSERPASEPAFGGGAKRDRLALGQTAFGLPNADAKAGPVSAVGKPATTSAQTGSFAWSESAESGGGSDTPLPPRMDEETSKFSSSGSSLTTRSPRGGDAAVTSRPPPPKSMLGPVMLAGAIVGVLALGAYLWLGQDDGPPVKVRIENENGAEKMVFEVAGATPGSKLRFGGIEQAIEGGQAVFPLGSGSLQVGRNAVLFDVLQPGGDSQAGKVVLSLDYRVTVDTAPLQTGKGAVDVVVAALPGSKVWLGGEELALDAQGRAQRREEIETSALKDGKSAEHVVSYRVQPPSQEPQVGQIKTIVPIASLEIDRPGLAIVTDQDSVEIAGAVDADSTVTLNGEPIAVQDGRFLHRLPLPAAGKHEPELIARATGKAPRAVKLSIERVDDMAAAARAFAPDASLSYAKIAQNPEIYAGQKAQFEGRIYNVSVDGGRSVLQMLVRDCPAGVRCPLWVEYGAATDLTVEKWVRAVGTIAGAQKFRAENDSEQTVPRLSAVVLVPIER